ncbi:MAG TPA: DinB family protein [Anaerolineae bacterium]|nr:DinB family protein [Anaerolineae bacterium]
MTVQRDLIQKRLRDEGDKLITMFERLSPEQQSLTLYSDGMDWSLKDLLAHLTSAERAFLYYGRDILNGGAGAPEGFDLNGFNQREVGQLRERAFAQLIDDLRAVRRETIEFVGQIADADFARRGRHPFFGQMSIDEMFKLIYRHTMLHLRDVRRAIGVEADGRP